MSQTPHPARFPTTLWSRVVAAGADDREALEALCRDYWFPLYALARRRGLSPDDAADLVQGFLADLIGRGDVARADPERGRFRTFLRAAILNHLSHARERDRAIKRGGGRPTLSIDVLASEGRYLALPEPADGLTPERLYERQWARELLRRALERLDAEAARAGNAALFAAIRPLLEGEDLPETYRALAAPLGLTEAALKMAVSRHRRRYREILRDEVARTVSDPAEVDDELSSLIRALGP